MKVDQLKVIVEALTHSHADCNHYETARDRHQNALDIASTALRHAEGNAERGESNTPEWAVQTLRDQVVEWIGGGSNRDEARTAINVLYEAATRYRTAISGIGEHALAGEIAAAVTADENGDGCDLSGGMFGTEMTALIRRIVNVYLSENSDAIRYRTWRDRMIAQDTRVPDIIEAALPKEVVGGDRMATPAEWDAAWDAVVKAVQP